MTSAQHNNAIVKNRPLSHVVSAVLLKLQSTDHWWFMAVHKMVLSVILHVINTII